MGLKHTKIRSALPTKSTDNLYDSSGIVEAWKIYDKKFNKWKT